MNDKPKKLTAVTQVREAIRALGSTEFTSSDILKNAVGSQRSQKFAALRNLTKWGELTLVRQGANGGGGLYNVYQAVNLAPENHKPPRKKSKEYKPRAAAEAARLVAASAWEDIWPELYQVPKFNQRGAITIKRY